MHSDVHSATVEHPRCIPTTAQCTRTTQATCAPQQHSQSNRHNNNGNSSNQPTSMREPFGSSNTSRATCLAGRSVAATACTLTALCLRLDAAAVTEAEEEPVMRTDKHINTTAGGQGRGEGVCRGVLTQLQFRAAVVAACVQPLLCPGMAHSPAQHTVWCPWMPTGCCSQLQVDTNLRGRTGLLENSTVPLRGCVPSWLRVAVICSRDRDKG